MQDAEPGLAADDEPVGMTMNERTVWAYLVAVVLSSGVYLTLMITRLTRQPADEIAWERPMLWTIGASVVGSIVVVIILTIAGTVSVSVARSVAAARASGDGRPAAPVVEIDAGSDARDKEIDRAGDHVLVGVLGAGFVGALALAMLDADTFWIGNLLFVVGTVGAIVETTTKIRLYRRGF